MSLPAVPADLVRQRIALHRLATYVIGPARHAVTGRFGLRSTPGGFGTPVFGDERRVRVERDQLVVEGADGERRTAITTLSAAAAFIGSEVDTEIAAEHDSPPPGDLDEPLDVTAGVVDFLASWWALGTAALETVRADDASVDASEVQLWPGHFDPAIEVGDEDRRGSYGASPGDDGSDEPYLYLSVWWPDRLVLDSDDAFWNAKGFTGAVLRYAELAESDDPVATAAEFFRAGRDRLVAAVGK